MGKRNIFVDIFKLALVFLIVCIHFHPYFEHYAIFRIGVPSFFIISGYFQYKNSNDNLNKERKFIKESLKYILIALLIYIVYDLIIAYKDNQSISNTFTCFFYKDFILNFITFNLPITSGYHLWYLIALFVVSIIHYFIVKYNKTYIYKYTFLLLIIPFFFSGLLFRLNNEFTSTAYTRNAIFTGLPLFSIGYELRRRNKERTILSLCIFLGVGLIFFYTQHLERVYIFKTQVEMYISSIISSIFLVLFFVNLPCVKSKIYYLIFGTKASLFTYIFHLMIGKICIKYYEYERSWMVCLISFFVSLGLAISINGMTVLVKHLYDKHKSKTEEHFIN